MQQQDTYVRLLVQGEDARDDLIKEYRNLIRAACEAWGQMVGHHSTHRIGEKCTARILKGVFGDDSTR